MIIVYTGNDGEWMGTNRLFGEIADAIYTRCQNDEEIIREFERADGQGALFINRKPDELRYRITILMKDIISKLINDYSVNPRHNLGNEGNRDVIESLEKLNEIL